MSIDKDDNIIGFMGTTINKNRDYVSDSKDLYEFLLKLFNEFKFRKACFSVVVGNPIEKMYNKYINKYGGRIAGIQKEEVILHDGELCDMKLYEIFKRDFDKVCKNKITRS